MLLGTGVHHRPRHDVAQSGNIVAPTHTFMPTWNATRAGDTHNGVSRGASSRPPPRADSLEGGGDGPRTLIRPRLRPFYGAVERSPSITRSPTRRPQRAATKSVLREQRTAEGAVRSCIGPPVLGGPDLFLYPSAFAGTSVEGLGNDFSCLVADIGRDGGIGIERGRFLGDALTLLDRHFPDHTFEERE